MTFEKTVSLTQPQKETIQWIFSTRSWWPSNWPTATYSLVRECWLEKCSNIRGSVRRNPIFYKITVKLGYCANLENVQANVCCYRSITKTKLSYDYIIWKNTYEEHWFGGLLLSTSSTVWGFSKPQIMHLCLSTLLLTWNISSSQKWCDLENRVQKIVN